MVLNKDIIIIGNGVLGLSTAFALVQKDPTLRLHIIGPRHRQGSATLAAGAMLNCFAEVTSMTFASKYGEAKFNMAHKASSMWLDWLDQINQQLPANDHLQIQQGTFVILNNKSGKLDSENYFAMVNALNKYGEPFEAVNPDSVPGMDTVDDCRPLQAIYLPREGCIDSGKVLQSLQAILERHENITFTEDIVEKINIQEDRVTSLTLKSGKTVFASQLILANGAFAQPLIDQIEDLQYEIPRLVAGTGYSVLMDQCSDHPIKHVIRTPNRAGACGLHALPRADNKLYLGATNNVHPSLHYLPSGGLLHFLLECGMQQINQGLYRSTLHQWSVGNRPATIDTFPLIGETPIQGLWMLNGTYRDGFHQSPLLSQHLAAQILEEDGLFENVFLPARRPLQILTKAESIRECVKHYMAGMYEHSAQLPKFMVSRDLGEMVQSKIEKLYAQLETDYGLMPDMLFMFEFAEDRESILGFFRNYFAKIATRYIERPEDNILLYKQA